MSKYFKIFFYVSLLFLLYALYRGGYLIIPKIYSGADIVLSILLLFLGFVFNGISWTVLLRKNKFNIRMTDGLNSVGLSIFGKYIPGKIWAIIGRSEYIASLYNYPRKEMGMLSLNAQFISIWVGLILGSMGLLWVGGFGYYSILILLMFAGLSLVIFTDVFHQLFERLSGKILKKAVNIPRIHFIHNLTTLPWFFLTWIFWSISFYFLADALIESSAPLVILGGFGLACSIGIISVIAPGGLGVREGILTGYLTLCGLELPQAATIAVASRLWFLLGEVFIFVLAMVMKYIYPNRSKERRNYNLSL